MKQRQWRPRGRIWRVVRRSSVTWWVGALVLASITTSFVSTNLRRASQAADDWGTQRRVWVVERTVAAGDVIGLGDATLDRRPKGVVPQGALDGASSPIGEATRVTLSPGEVVLTERLAGRGAHGLAALIPPGYRALAVRNDESIPTVRVGDRVDVIATFDVANDVENAGAAPAAPSFPVATNAEVLRVSSRTITLAVTIKEAPRVAFALARAAVTLSLRGGASERSRYR